MASVKLFYVVKLYDETDCFEKHIKKIYEIQDHIKECFKAHTVRDRVFNHYVFWHEATVSEATHIQYLDSEGVIRIVKINYGKRKAILCRKTMRRNGLFRETY